jgi:hypothetical protein
MRGSGGGGSTGAAFDGAEWPIPNDPVDVASGAPNPDSYTDNGDDTVTDNVTGLMWQKAIVAAASSLSWAAAKGYCPTVSTGGHNDWRLPAMIELVSLIDPSVAQVTIDSTYFPATPSGGYWASTPALGQADRAFYVDFSTAAMGSIDVSTTDHVRCVRTPAPAAATAERYTPGAGTVLDNKTKLVWQEQGPGTQQFLWDGARTYCAGVGATLGGTGWRLPTMKELLSLCDPSRINPAIDPDFSVAMFSIGSATFYWTSTPDAARSPAINAWAVFFSGGGAASEGKSTSGFVRCVR